MMDGLDIAEELSLQVTEYVCLFSCLVFVCTILENNDYSVYLIANQAFEAGETMSDQSQNSETESGNETLKTKAKPNLLTKFYIFFIC